RAPVVVPHISERRFESRDLCAREFLFLQQAGHSGGAGNRALCIEHRYFVRNAPGGDAFGFTDPFDPIDDAVSIQDLLIIETELVGDERWRPIVICPAQNPSSLTIFSWMVERILDQESSIDPEITALPILHPRQNALQKVKK